MRWFIVLLSLSFISKSAFCQQELKQIDSLEKILYQEKTVSLQADLENQLAVLYYNVDLKKSLRYGQLALEHSKSLEYESGLQHAYGILRRVHRRLGNFNMAIEYSLINLPRIEQFKDTTELLDVYSSLGNNYSSLQNFKEANRYLFKAYYIGSKVNAPSLSNIMSFIGRSYGKMDMLDSAQYWIEKALALEKQFPQPGFALYYISNNLGEVLCLKKDYEQALQVYNTALALPEERRNRLGETFTYNGLALVYQGMKEYDQAIAMAKHSAEVALKNSYRDKAKEAFGILHEIYSEMKDYKNALLYYKKFNIYEDSIFSEDRIQYIENLKITYETEKMEQENELLKKNADLKDARLDQQRMLAWSAVLVTLLLIISFIFLYRNFNQKKKTNRLLAQYNHDLEQQVKERTSELTNTNLELVKQNNQLEQFGYITAHNLRAPVARILGLTNVINSASFAMPQDKEVLDKLELSAKDLDTVIFDLNRILDIKKGLQTTFDVVNIPDQIEKVKNILRDKLRDSNARIISNLQIQTCFAIPAYIESIFYNLISNGIKYRSPDRDPEIHISTHQELDMLKLIVRDNGLGIDLHKLKDKVFNLYQRFHSHVEGKGLGLFLVKTQVESLNGTIEIESTIDVGTTFTITIPMTHPAA